MPITPCHQIILDSGAFSAWSRGAAINIDDYITFCKQHLNGITYFVNLDVIPGTPGQKRIPLVEIERSAGLGWENFEKMVAAGIPSDRVIHVFHQNEDFRWLQRMLDDPRMDYIGLSPANDRTTPEKMMWLDDCMKYVCDSTTHKPMIKFHGFAVTSTALMRRYPWYSVDSSSWVVIAGRGRIWVPPKAGRSWDYASQPHTVPVSFITKYPDHFKHRGPAFQRMVLDYLDAVEVPWGASRWELVDESVPCDGDSTRRIYSAAIREAEGFNEPPLGKKWVEVVDEWGVLNSAYYRAEVNIKYLQNFNHTLPQWPWPWEAGRTTLF